jgi:hypothetical protein
MKKERVIHHVPRRDSRDLIFPRFDGVVECGKASLEKRRS